ncbi:MAG: hypothetical protein JRH20_16300 [Deltaproteobacteria bacterium]|nr:hypothetical protein [Deltaproteobacteria bacterium]
MGGLALLLVACEGRQGGIPPRLEKPAQQAFDADTLGKDHASTLSALAMPHHAFAALLGPHQISANSKLETTGREGKVITQKLVLVADGQGHFSARKITDEHYGYELVWTGEWLYSRLRYHPFSRRRPEDALEPSRLADREYGLVGAYIRLLKPFIQVSRGALGRVEGREVIHVSFSRRAQPVSSPSGKGASSARQQPESSPSGKGSHGGLSQCLLLVARALRAPASSQCLLLVARALRAPASRRDRQVCSARQNVGGAVLTSSTLWAKRHWMRRRGHR